MKCQKHLSTKNGKSIVKVDETRIAETKSAHCLRLVT